MLDYTKKLTSEEIWQDCLTDRLTDVLIHLKNPRIMPAGFSIDLQGILPLPGRRSAVFNLVVSGPRQPLTYAFNVRSSPESSFHVTPVDPRFIMRNHQLKDGYAMTDAESGFGGLFAADILRTYIEELGAPGFDPTGPRARQSQNMKPVLN